MIHSVTARDYQSLHRAEIKLGRFTVVTGHTGSGKSSLIRAIKLLVFNAPGLSYVRHGQTATQVALAFELDGGPAAVGIERAGRGKDFYRIVVGPETKEFTKLGGEIPEAGQALLGITELNFASQFDRPYLLADSGGKVAQTLGQLTNVTLVFKAAREANRRKLATAVSQRGVQGRLDRAIQDAQRFKGLPKRRGHVQAAEEALARAQAVQAKLTRLGQLSVKLTQAATALRELPPAVELPSLDTAVVLDRKLSRLRQLNTQVSAAYTIGRQAVARAREEIKRGEDAKDAYDRVLVEAGNCPTCGQSTAGGHAHSRKA